MEEDQSRQQPKSKLKKKKVIIVLIIDFIVALLADGLSFFKVYDPNASCQLPECLGWHGIKYYGYPFKYLTMKPTGYEFRFVSFLANFFLYFLIVLIFSFLIILIVKKIRKK